MKQLVPPGRLDALTHEMLKVGLKQHGNPGLRIAAKMCESQISQALTESLGPGTKAGKWGETIAQAVNEFERKLMEARAQIQAEDAE
jgi:hypothetical protein